MFEDDDSDFAAMRAGARGYLLKGAGQERSYERSVPPLRARRSSVLRSRLA
jgi:DNA-binding NarL/FixJ family response regulator